MEQRPQQVTRSAQYIGVQAVLHRAALHSVRQLDSEESLSWLGVNRRRTHQQEETSSSTPLYLARASFTLDC